MIFILANILGPYWDYNKALGVVLNQAVYIKGRQTLLIVWLYLKIYTLNTDQKNDGVEIFHHFPSCREYSHVWVILLTIVMFG